MFSASGKIKSATVFWFESEFYDLSEVRLISKEIEEEFMGFLRKKAKPLAIFLAFLVLVLSVPYQSALAAIIETETIIDVARGQEARDRIKSILARDDVQSALIAHGIDPLEAKARIDGLSDAEVIHISDKIDQLPAGGGTFETILIIALITFLILLFTDIMGYTDIFPFVKSK